MPIQDGDEEGKPLDTWRVIFYSAGDAPEEICSVRVSMTARVAPVFTLYEPRIPVPDGLLMLIRARYTALRAVGPLSQPQNPVMLIAQWRGQPCIGVFLLAGSPRNHVAVLGKHHRVRVSLDGKEVLSVEPLSKSAIEVPLTLEAPVERGRANAGIYVTHLVTEWPLETHVFASLLHKTPIMVGTSRGNWWVEGMKISLMPAQPPAPAPVARAPTPARPPVEPIEAPPRFGAILARKPWWRFW